MKSTYRPKTLRKMNFTLMERIRALSFCLRSRHTTSPILKICADLYLCDFEKVLTACWNTQDGDVLQRAEKEILHYLWKLNFFLLVNNLIWDKLLGLKFASARSHSPLDPLKDSVWPSAVGHISQPIKMLSEILELVSLGGEKQQKSIFRWLSTTHFQLQWTD